MLRFEQNFISDHSQIVTMVDINITSLENALFKEAFDEFDKVEVFCLVKTFF